MGKLQGNDAAFVAARLTEAECTLLGGIAAGRKHDNPENIDTSTLVRGLYEDHLAYVLDYDSGR